MHPYDSQKNEALNRAFMKLAPKSIIFSKTFSLFDCLSFVIIVDSLGYEDGLHWLLATIYNTPSSLLGLVQQEWAKLEDLFKKYIHDWQKTKKVRCTSDKKKNLMKKRLNNNKAKRKGDGYHCGIGMVTEAINENVHATIKGSSAAWQ